jgi:hypothetical protein
MTETEIMRFAMLSASACGHRLWRNSVAMFRDAHGNIVRTGLARKSADTIGLRYPDGRFISIEFKRPGWRPPLSGPRLEHHEGQLAWQNMIRRLGGLAGFATSVEEAMAIIEGRTP